MSEAKFLLRIPETLKDELSELAKKDKRSLNKYIETVLEEHIRKLKGMPRDPNKLHIDINLPNE
jgi:hypothetical protein